MSKAKPYVAKQPEKLTYKNVQGTLLYIFLIPLFLAVVLALFQTNIQAFLLSGISFFLFLAVATLAKKGFTQEHAYKESIFTKAPKIPYKMYAGYLLGGATFFTSLVTGGQPFVKSAFLALIATVGYYLLYGFDPKKDKLENIGDISAEFVLETISEAKAKLSEVEVDMLEIKDTILHDKLQKALVKADHILKTIQEDPKDVRVARKFLTVYIDGIAKVTKSYTELDETDINTQTTQRLHTLMDDVEERLSKELQRLKNNNAFDLDVHIDVLKEQIKG
jgi:5-bromo-4-chloroindolyl phosphate hydrolysis protein